MQSEPTWDDLRVLLALHRHHSFLAAGKALGLSTSTAARRISALEEALGRTLVHRTSGGTTLEAEALALVALAEQLELGLHATQRSEGATAGTVRLSMGEGFVRPSIRALGEVRRKHPQLHLEVISESRLADVARREVDLAVRKVKSSSPVLVERTLGRLSFGLYAAQSYVERRLRGGRLEPSDVARHDFISHDTAQHGMPTNQWLHAHGVRRVPFRSNSDVAIETACVDGQGIALLADAQGRTLPGLVRLDFAGQLPSVPVFLVFHRDLRRVPRVQLVARALADLGRQALG